MSNTRLTQESIYKMLGEYRDYSNMADPAGVANLYTEDALVTIDDAARWYGREEIFEKLKLEYANPNRVPPHVHVENISISKDGRSALVTEYFVDRSQDKPSVGEVSNHIVLRDGEPRIWTEQIITIEST